VVKLALGMIVFNGMPFVEGVLETWHPYVEQIIVAEGPVRFWQDQGYERSTDGTQEFLLGYKERRSFGKMDFVTGAWKDKLEMCNAWLSHVRDDITHVLCFDADEFMLKADIEWLINQIRALDLDSAGFRLHSFVGGFDRYLTGFEEKLEVIRLQRYEPGAVWKSHRPPTILNPSTGRSWKESGRHLSYDTADYYGVRLYHYSHVLPSQIRMKERYYADYMRAKNVIPDYYKNVWLPWVMTDDVGKSRIEQRWHGIHDFHPSYRGDCYSRPFLGKHPWWIEKNNERILEMQKQQMSAD
jgi:hypothetical protein